MEKFGSDIWIAAIAVIATLLMACWIGWKFWKIATGKSVWEKAPNDKSPPCKPGSKP